MAIIVEKTAQASSYKPYYHRFAAIIFSNYLDAPFNDQNECSIDP